MWVYLYPSWVETALSNAYIWEWVDVTSLTLDKSSISLTTVWQTEQITATTVPAWATVNWSSSDTTVATVSSSWLVTCVSPWSCTITAESFGVTATCNVSDNSWWQPWANTVLYYDFEWDSWTSVTNKWTRGSSMNWTATWVTFQTLASWKAVAYKSDTSRSNWIKCNSINSLPSSFTWWAWAKSNSATNQRQALFWWQSPWEWNIWLNADGWKTNCTTHDGNDWVWYGKSSTVTTDWNWHLITWTYDSVNWNQVYKDGAALTFTTANWNYMNNTAISNAQLGCMCTSNTSYDWSFNWMVGCCWIESVRWTVQDISDYYDLTKANYWIN